VIKYLLRANIAVVTVAWVALFVPLYYLTGKDVSFEISNGLILCVGTGAAIAWSKGICHNIGRSWNELESSDMLMLAIVIISISTAALFVTLWVFRVTEDPWWNNSLISGIARWLLVYGLLLIMLPADSVKQQVPPRAYVRAGLYVTAAMAIVVVLVAIGWS